MEKRGGGEEETRRTFGTEQEARGKGVRLEAGFALDLSTKRRNGRSWTHRIPHSGNLPFADHVNGAEIRYPLGDTGGDIMILESPERKKNTVSA